MEREEIVQLLDDFRGSLLGELKGVLSRKGDESEGDDKTEQPQIHVPGLKEKDADIVNKIVLALEAKNKSSAEQVYQTMFDERVSLITSQYPGFGEYLSSKDDFGDVILDRVNKISDYNERVKALDRLFKSYAQAQPSNAEGMRLTKEMREEVQRDEENREEIKRKFLKGEIDHSEFTDQFFSSLESQIERIKAGRK